MICLPRWLHRLYSDALDYFWLPCPRCGRTFGGHEKTGGSVPHPTRPGINRVTCSNCPGE